MRAKLINNAYCFDFDETLVTTDAKIHVYRNNVLIKTLNSKEFNTYKLNANDKFDFSEFRDGDKILNAKKYKLWPLFKTINDAIKYNKSSSELYILTARGVSCKPYIYEYLKRNGIYIPIKNILTIGDEAGKISISDKKRDILSDLVKKYNRVTFFDDDIKNIKLAQTIHGIKTKLVESLNESDITDETFDVKNKIKNSKSLSSEIKEKILPLVVINGIHGTRYKNGKVYRLRYDDSKDCDLGADENGFFVFTHRARSKSYKEIDKIPEKDIKFIESTG